MQRNWLNAIRTISVGIPISCRIEMWAKQELGSRRIERQSYKKILSVIVYNITTTTTTTTTTIITIKTILPNKVLKQILPNELLKVINTYVYIYA